MLFVWCYVFLLGACMGSFINVLGLRAVEEKPLWNGRSCCDHCNHQVAWYDLVPILNYIWLRGKCRYCGNKIGVRHLVVEIVDGLLSLLIVYRLGFDWYTFVVFVVLQIFILLSLIDFDVMIIPDELNVILLIIAIISWLCFPMNISFASRLLGLVSVSGIMVLINRFIGESFGGGDIKLMIVCGFWLGLKLTLFSGCVAVLLAGVYAVYLLKSKRVNKKDYIPFGPFLCLGMIFAITYGTQVVEWYLSLF